MIDLAIIGAGPAGYAAAQEAARCGLKAIIFEKQQLGGTCLNRGCVPTKFYLNALLQQKKNSLYNQQPSAIGASYLFEKKAQLVENLRKSIYAHLQSLHIPVQFEEAIITAPGTIQTRTSSFESKNILIATGSKPRTLPMLPPEKMLFADDFLEHPSDFSNILIVGAGAIGIEMAFLFRALGKAVTLIEKEKTILSFMDSEIQRRALGYLKKEEIEVFTGKTVETFDTNKFEKIMVSIGRSPSIENCFSQSLPIALLPNGSIKTDQDFRTSIDTIYACGDVRGAPLYAYTADYQGKFVAQLLAKKNPAQYGIFPECVFGFPQIAKVGATEDELKARNIAYNTRKGSFRASSAAHLYGDTEGFVKILCDASGLILGAHIISQLASELISVFSVAMNHQIQFDQLRKNPLIHPTLSESLFLVS